MSTPFLRDQIAKISFGLFFLRERAKITAWNRNYLVLVYVRFRALNLTYILVLTQSVLRICARKTLYKHAHLEAARPEKK